MQSLHVSSMLIVEATVSGPPGATVPLLPVIHPTQLNYNYIYYLALLCSFNITNDDSDVLLHGVEYYHQ